MNSRFPAGFLPAIRKSQQIKALHEFEGENPLRYSEKAGQYRIGRIDVGSNALDPVLAGRSAAMSPLRSNKCVSKSTGFSTTRHGHAVSHDPDSGDHLYNNGWRRSPDRVQQ